MQVLPDVDGVFNLVAAVAKVAVADARRGDYKAAHGWGSVHPLPRLWRYLQTPSA